MALRCNLHEHNIFSVILQLTLFCANNTIAARLLARGGRIIRLYTLGAADRYLCKQSFVWYTD